MAVVILQALGGLAFAVGSLVLGLWLRKHPTKEQAERASRISHGLYWVALVLPGFVGILHPGLARFDEILGIPSLPARPVTEVLGAVAVLAGLVLTLASQVPLRRLGEGANAFMLTKRVVTGKIYARTRNPMSLGYYLLCVGLGLIARSTYITLGSLLGVVPVHLFNLVYFEEYELELRLGQPYLEYKERVPLIFPRLGSSRSVE